MLLLIIGGGKDGHGCSEERCGARERESGEASPSEVVMRGDGAGGINWKREGEED